MTNTPFKGNRINKLMNEKIKMMKLNDTGAGIVEPMVKYMEGLTITLNEKEKEHLQKKIKLIVKEVDDYMWGYEEFMTELLTKHLL